MSGMRMILAGLVGLTLVCGTARAAEPTTRPAGPTTRPGQAPFMGKLLKVDEKSITVQGRRAGKREMLELTFSIDARTQFFTGRIDGERINARGDTVRRVRMEPGTAADLKVGENAMVMADEEGRALRISSVPPLVVPATRPSRGAR